MNIALFPSAFHPSLGGVEELSRQLAHHLIAQGHKVAIFTNRWPKDLPADETFEGLSIHRYIFRVPENNARQFAGALLHGPATLNRLCRNLRDFNADLLHVQCVSSNAWYALKARHRLRIPLVVSLQGELTMDATQLFQRSAFARRLMRCCLTEANALTACSGHTLAEAKEFLGEPFAIPASVIFNGVRLADFANIKPHAYGSPYFFALGRFVPQKGFDILIRAFAKAAADASFKQDLLLAGDGPNAADLRALVAELKLENRIHFVGRANRAQTAALFAGADWFVLPSRHEPQGIVNLEAMASAKAVIATRVGGVPEIVHHEKTGLLIPPADVDALAAALLKFSSDPSLRATFGIAGYQRAEQFDWTQIATQYANLCHQLCPSLACPEKICVNP